jgi:glycosyltransferase involved in cell wall biosynthesis
VASAPRASSRPRILVIAPRYPYPPWRGDQLRVHHLARHLARAAEVRIVCLGSGASSLGPVSVRTVQPTLAGRLAANLRRPWPALPLQVRAFLDSGMRRAVDEEVEAFRPDVVHVSLSRMAPYLNATWACHRHLDLVDSMWLNMTTRARESPVPSKLVFGLEARLVGRYEARVLDQVDSVSVVTEADREAPGLAAATVVPNGIDPDQFPYRDPADRPPVALFFGNLGYFHNIAPARFLATEVLPRIRSREPEATLRLAGARPTGSVRRLAKLPGVELVANPSEMAPVLHGAAVAAIPMSSGSGMKNKVLEAFCAGLPVITNARGIDGIEGAVPGVHYLLAEGPAEIAEQAAAAMVDPTLRSRLSRAARELAVTRHSWDRQAHRLLALYGIGG